MPELSPLTAGDPTIIGGYRVAGRLGEGGQGRVYLAYGPAGERVAVKVLHARFGADPTARARFAREVEAARRVAPFCTARVLAADVQGTMPYLVSEYVEGPSLHELVHRGGPLAEPALRRLAIGTLTALAAIHQAEIVHRDLKPGNVVLSAQGPRVVDFGIARALDVTSSLTSQVIGTPAYMAPEQFSDGPITPAIDMFSWACTMGYAAIGMPPFGNGTLPVVIARILEGRPQVDAVAGPLRDMLVACLDKNPANRPTARQLLSRLLGTPQVDLADAARAAVPDRAELATFGVPSRPASNRHGALIGVAAGVAALGLIGGLLYVVLSGRGGTPADARTNGHSVASTQASPRAAATPTGGALLFSRLPKACEAPGSTLPARARVATAKPGKNDTADFTSCVWELLHTDQAVSFEVEISSKSTVSAAQGDIQRDREFWGNKQENGGYWSDPAPVPGLGDEAVAARHYSEVTYSPGDQLSKTYKMGGCEVEARLRNVNVKVSWAGADYPPSVRQSYILDGTRFSYDQTRQEAIAVIKQVFTQLS